MSLKSFNGFFGTDLFMFATDISQYQTYFVFQAMFVATEATIISGAVAERLKFYSYVIITFFTSGIIYPLVGHWIWAFDFSNPAKKFGWLGKLGFIEANLNFGINDKEIKNNLKKIIKDL